MLQGKALDRPKMKAPESREEDPTRKARRGTNGCASNAEAVALRSASEASARAAAGGQEYKVWLCHTNLHFLEVYSVHE